MALNVDSTEEVIFRETEDKLNRRYKLKKNAKKAVLVGVNLAVVLVVLFPLLYALFMSLKTPGEIYSSELDLFPESLQFSNYGDAFKAAPLGQYIWNSFIVAGLITLGQLITGAFAAFSFHFTQYKGKEILFSLVMATMMVPGEATIISNYLQVSKWGWLDSYKVLIIPYLTSATTIFLFRQFYKNFPMSLYESAKIDGASNVRFLFQILLPLTKPAIGAVAVNAFINAWNMYMWPLLVTGSDSYRTVQIGVSMMNSIDSQSIVLMLAGVVICLIPSLLIFVLGQKSLVRGLMSGSVKG